MTIFLLFLGAFFGAIVVAIATEKDRRKGGFPILFCSFAAIFSLGLALLLK